MSHLHRFVAPALTAAVSLFAVQAQAATVGWNFGLNGGNATLSSTDVAGAPDYRQANWNNQSPGQGAPADPTKALNDSDGNASGVSITGWTQANGNSWHMDPAPTTSDETLMYAYVGPGPTLTFEGLDTFAPLGYDVVVYYARGGTNQVETALNVNTLTETIRYKTGVSDYKGFGYILHEDGEQSNYAVFANLTDDVVTISTGITPSLQGNFGITAIQFVPVPEPASLALLGLGGLALIGRRTHR